MIGVAVFAYVLWKPKAEPVADVPADDPAPMHRPPKFNVKNQAPTEPTIRVVAPSGLTRLSWVGNRHASTGARGAAGMVYCFARPLTNACHSIRMKRYGI